MHIFRLSISLWTVLLTIGYFVTHNQDLIVSSMYSFSILVLIEIYELHKKVDKTMNPNKISINLNGKLWITTDEDEMTKEVKSKIEETQ